MRAALFGQTDAEYPAHESGIADVHLGHPYQELAKFRVQWQKPEGTKAGFENFEPGIGGRLRYFAFPCKGYEVEQLRGSTGAWFDKALECGEIADIADRADIEFDVGCFCRLPSSHSA